MCLCSQLPQSLFQTRTHILILQHPHEARHKLSTVPLLTHCLSNCHVIVGRRFLPASFPVLQSASSTPALLLFPSDSAQPISNWFAIHRLDCPPCQSPDFSTSNSYNLGDFATPNCRNSCNLGDLGDLSTSHPRLSSQIAAEDLGPHILLLVVDATWQHAREMIKASAPFLEKFAVPVCLPFDVKQEGSCMGNSDLILRKEPFEGCVSTMEAVASCLRVLEPNGIEIEQKLLCVLRKMVEFQASRISAPKFRARRTDGESSHSTYAKTLEQLGSRRHFISLFDCS